MFRNRSSERNDFLHIENEFSVFEGSKLPLGLEFNVRLKNLDALYKYSLEKNPASCLAMLNLPESSGLEWATSHSEDTPIRFLLSDTKINQLGLSEN